MTYHFREGSRPEGEPLRDLKGSRSPIVERQASVDTARPIGEIIGPLVERLMRNRGSE